MMEEEKESQDGPASFSEFPQQLWYTDDADYAAYYI